MSQYSQLNKDIVFDFSMIKDQLISCRSSRTLPLLRLSSLRRKRRKESDPFFFSVSLLLFCPVIFSLPKDSNSILACVVGGFHHMPPVLAQLRPFLCTPWPPVRHPASNVCHWFLCHSVPLTLNVLRLTNCIPCAACAYY